MKTKISIWWFPIVFIILVALMQQCEGNTKTVTNTEVNITEVIDSVRRATLKDVKTVYIDTSKTYTKWLKGKTITKDSIVYVDKSNESTIKANQYFTEIQSDSATAKLNITTTGELLDVQGVITYPRIETTTTITNTRDASGKFIFLKTDMLNPLQNLELGVFAHINNKFGVIASINYDKRLNNNSSVTIGGAIKF